MTDRELRNEFDSKKNGTLDFGHERCKCEPAMIACSPGDTGNDMTLILMKALHDSDLFFVPEALDPTLAPGSVVRDPR